MSGERSQELEDSDKWLNQTKKIVRQEEFWKRKDERCNREEQKQEKGLIKESEKKLSVQDKRGIRQLELFFSALEETQRNPVCKNIEINEATIKAVLVRALNNQNNSTAGIYVFKERDITPIIESLSAKPINEIELNFCILQAMDSIKRL